jgi:DNA-binding LacI/PurR family transcriptional regulator
MEYFSCLATDYGLEFSGQVQHHNGRVDEIYEFAGKLLKKNITALLCMGETVGIPVAYALNLFGKNIPEDVSYICHELENISKFNLPPLTTLAQDFSAIGELCLDVITSYHDSHSLLKREKMVDYIFNERDSVVSV